MYLVAGATGNVGGELVRALTGADEPVRALIRSDADRAKLPEGAEGFVCDLNDPNSLRPALDGVRGAHLLAGYEGLDGLLAEMPSAGVERVVLQSSSAAPTGDLTDAVAKYHILSERAIEESGLAWTFLRPNSFMSNALRWLPQLAAGDVVHDAFPDVPVATIDPYDVAAVSAAALTSGEHDGQAYRLSGPDSLLPAERLAILAKSLGRDLRFEGQSDEEARAEMSENMPAAYVDSFFRVFRGDDIDESTVLPTVREVLGREPRSFEEWAVEHADAFGER
jgi:uncharacterized protein YbjT (DUF2867 family)